MVGSRGSPGLSVESMRLEASLCGLLPFCVGSGAGNRFHVFGIAGVLLGMVGIGGLHPPLRASQGVC